MFVDVTDLYMINKDCKCLVAVQEVDGAVVDPLAAKAGLAGARIALTTNMYYIDYIPYTRYCILL